MYAIVRIGGKQFRVHEEDTLFVPHAADAKAGDTMVVDEVLLLADGDDIQVGRPVVEGASVTASVLEHVKGDKIVVFKKKRRKRYRVLRGHRQPYTKIQVVSFSTTESTSNGA